MRRVSSASACLLAGRRCPSIRLSGYPAVRLAACLSACPGLPACLPGCLAVCLSVSLLVCLSCLPVCLSVSLPACPSVLLLGPSGFARVRMRKLVRLKQMTTRKTAGVHHFGACLAWASQSWISIFRLSLSAELKWRKACQYSAPELILGKLEGQGHGFLQCGDRGVEIGHSILDQRQDEQKMRVIPG